MNEKPNDDKPAKERPWEAEVRTKVNYAHGRLYLWERIGDGAITVNGESIQFTAGRVVGGASLLIHVEGYGFFEIEGAPLFHAAAALIADAMESGDVKPREGRKP